MGHDNFFAAQSRSTNPNLFIFILNLNKDFIERKRKIEESSNLELAPAKLCTPCSSKMKNIILLLENKAYEASTRLFCKYVLTLK